MEVFVSYRRADVPDVVGRLHDHLINAFGEEHVFFDRSSIGYGEDFRAAVRRVIASVDAVVLVIGPGFAPERLGSPDDFVRMELEESLAYGRRIVPVRVGDAPMPTPDQFPAGLADIAYRHAAHLRPDPDFRADTARLIESLRHPPAEEAGPRPRAAITTAAIVARKDAAYHEIELGFVGFVSDLAFSPDGAYLATASDDAAVQLWRAGLGERARTLRGVPPAIPLSGGAADDRRALPPWLRAIGRHLPRLAGHTDEVHAVAFVPDGSGLASAGLDGRVLLWNPNSGRRILALAAGEPLQAVAVAPIGHCFAAAGRAVHLWDFDAPGSERHRALAPATNDGFDAVAFSPDGSTLAAAARDHRLRVWDRSGDLRFERADHEGPVRGVAFARDGSALASAGADATVRLWSPDDGTAGRVLRVDAREATAVAFSPDGSVLAAGTTEATVQLWEPFTGRRLGELSGRGSVTALAFSPDGGLLAVAGGTYDQDTPFIVRLWRLATTPPLR